MHRLPALACAAALLLTGLTHAAPAGQAGQAAPAAADPALEARVLHVAEELRCLVCQNETIAASQAALAVDLRAQIREQMRAGRSDAQIREHMVARYGDFILYRPPWRASTLLLWLGPFGLLLAAIAGWQVVVRNRARTVSPSAAAQASGVALGPATGGPGDDEVARGWALLQADPPARMPGAPSTVSTVSKSGPQGAAR